MDVATNCIRERSGTRHVAERNHNHVLVQLIMQAKCARVENISGVCTTKLHRYDSVVTSEIDCIDQIGDPHGTAPLPSPTLSPVIAPGTL